MPLARAMCDCHTGIGADGSILYTRAADGAAMTLLNADGSRAEVSGNGLRGLAALLLRDDERADVTIRTEAGEKRLRRIDRQGPRQTFTASMGAPADVRTGVAAKRCAWSCSTWATRSASCSVRFHTSNDSWRFSVPQSSITRKFWMRNVEFAEVETPERVRILIQDSDALRRFDLGEFHVGAVRKLRVMLDRGTETPESFVVWKRTEHDALRVAHVEHDHAQRFAASHQRHLSNVGWCAHRRRERLTRALSVDPAEPFLRRPRSESSRRRGQSSRSSSAASPREVRCPTPPRGCRRRSAGVIDAPSAAGVEGSTRRRQFRCGDRTSPARASARRRTPHR